MREPQQSETSRIGAAIKRLGWRKGEQRAGERKVKVYRRGTDEDGAWRIDVMPSGGVKRVRGPIGGG